MEKHVLMMQEKTGKFTLQFLLLEHIYDLQEKNKKNNTKRANVPGFFNSNKKNQYWWWHSGLLRNKKKSVRIYQCIYLLCDMWFRVLPPLVFLLLTMPFMSLHDFLWKERHYNIVKLLLFQLQLPDNVIRLLTINFLILFSLWSPSCVWKLDPT